MYFCSMERRFKFIYGLTICAIIAYSFVQGYWLYSRYRLSLEEYKSELYSTIIACAEEEMAIRNTLPHPPRFYGNRFRKTYDIKGNDAVETWRYEVFAHGGMKSLHLIRYIIFPKERLRVGERSSGIQMPIHIYWII